MDQFDKDAAEKLETDNRALRAKLAAMSKVVEAADPMCEAFKALCRRIVETGHTEEILDDATMEKHKGAGRKMVDALTALSQCVSLTGKPLKEKMAAWGRSLVAQAPAGSQVMNHEWCAQCLQDQSQSTGGPKDCRQCAWFSAPKTEPAREDGGRGSR